MQTFINEKQTIQLDKSIETIQIEIYWGRIKNLCGEDVDLDSELLILDKDGKVRCSSDFLFYNNTCSNDRSVLLLGDNIGGANFDDSMQIALSNLPDYVWKIVITASIYDAVTRRQSFEMVSDTNIRVIKTCNGTDKYDMPIAQFNYLNELPDGDVVQLLELIRGDGGWVIEKTVVGFHGGLEALCNNYGLFFD